MVKMVKMVERVVGDGVQTWSSSSWRLTSDSEAQAGWMSGQSHMHSTHRACHSRVTSKNKLASLQIDIQGTGQMAIWLPALTLVRVLDWQTQCSLRVS